jgi:low affinity Fe/Cu permease
MDRNGREMGGLTASPAADVDRPSRRHQAVATPRHPLRPVYAGMARLSAVVADIAAHPVAQIGVLLGCVAWVMLGGSEARLASGVSIGSFVLTQMVLNQQRRRELALHVKIDELVRAKTGARDELAGIERKSEEEIEALRLSDEE